MRDRMHRRSQEGEQGEEAVAVRDGVVAVLEYLDIRLHLDLIAMESGEDAPIRATGLEGLSLDELGAQVIPIVPRQAAAIAAAAAVLLEHTRRA